jgi:hypothetical protein
VESIATNASYANFADLNIIRDWSPWIVIMLIDGRLSNGRLANGRPTNSCWSSRKTR